MDINSIVGEIVIHNVYGKGKIKSVYRVYEKDSNYCISVTFDEVDEDRKFLFPYIITELKKINTHSEKINQIIEQLTVCHHCGKTSNKLEYFDDIYLCESCYSKAEKCDSCNKVIFDNISVVELGSYSNVVINCCEKCLKYYPVCENCQKNYDMRKCLNMYPDLPQKYNICEDCIEDVFPYCDICHGFKFNNEKIINVDGFIICESCKINHSYNCKKCGELALKINHNFFANDGLCKNCRINQQYIEYIKKKFSGDFNMINVHFYDFINVKTVQFMTKIIDSNSILALGMPLINESLLIVHDAPSDYTIKSSEKLTVSELKKKKYYEFNTMMKKHSNDIILESNCNGKEITIWKSPICLRAVTEYDMDFCKEWHNGRLTYNGNNYGDTSSFYIIGTII